MRTRKRVPVVEQSVNTAGTTIFIDLHGAKRLDDVKSAERATKRAVESLGLKLKSLHLDRVAGGGVSGVAVLGSGHLSLQACSRTGFAAVDARGCAGLKPEVALLALANAFEAREAVIRRKRTGADLAVPALRVVRQSTAESAAPEGTGESGLSAACTLYDQQTGAAIGISRSRLSRAWLP